MKKTCYTLLITSSLLMALGWLCTEDDFKIDLFGDFFLRKEERDGSSKRQNF